jgi:phospholipid/cholesterol/gamma-HCH transport system substrate-binding protein
MAEEFDTDNRTSARGRILAGIALVLAIGLVAAYLVWPSSDYVVRAQFQAANQMIPGNLVMIAGHKVGLVSDVKLTEDGQAELELALDKQFSPLREGTEATIRIASLSGSVNRYVDLRIPPDGGAEIPEHGLIPATQTHSAVDLYQLFQTFDGETRKGLRKVVRGGGQQWRGVAGDQAAAGWSYLNPSLVASRRLFDELSTDRRALERFVVANAGLATHVAERDEDLATLVDKLADTTGAIAQEEDDLSDVIRQAAPFMRRANSTYVNLRSTLDELDPLISATGKAAPKLRAVMAELVPFARDARSPVRDLSQTIRRPGAGNDLVELGRAILPFRNIAVGPVRRNGAQRPGSLDQIATSLQRQTPKAAFFRPYVVDFTGWLDDFSHSGVYDANGSASRVATSVNAYAAVGGQLQLVPQELRTQLTDAVTARGQNNRCPGSMERPWEDESNPWQPFATFNCDPTQLPPGA